MQNATARIALQTATATLAEHDIQQSRLDAEVLLAHILGIPRLAIYTSPDQPLTPEQESHFQELVRRRAEGEPVAYIVGEREFFSLPFYVDGSVLIPRPETEFVVETALKHLQPAVAAKGSALFYDIGAGAGPIAVATLANLPPARAIATDISAAAIEVARRNAERHGVAGRLEFVVGDLFAGRTERADAVLSNPPYVMESEADLLACDVRDHEPHVALFGGREGLAVIRRLIVESPARLHSGGWLIFEIGYTHESVVRELIEQDGRYKTLEIRNDLSGIPRVVIASI